MVLRLALLVFVVTIPIVGWIAPLNNQAWRDARLPALSAEYRGKRAAAAGQKQGSLAFDLAGAAVGLLAFWLVLQFHADLFG